MKFTKLPLLCKQLTTLGADSGFSVKLDRKVPAAHQDTAHIVEGILQSLGDQTMAEYLNAAQLKALHSASDFTDDERVSDVLFRDPEVCVAVYDCGDRKLFKDTFRQACRFINEFAECAFEGDVGAAIGMF